MRHVPVASQSPSRQPAGNTARFVTDENVFVRISFHTFGNTTVVGVYALHSDENSNIRCQNAGLSGLFCSINDALSMSATPPRQLANCRPSTPTISDATRCIVCVRIPSEMCVAGSSSIVPSHPMWNTGTVPSNTEAHVLGVVLANAFPDRRDVDATDVTPSYRVPSHACSAGITPPHTMCASVDAVHPFKNHVPTGVWIGFASAAPPISVFCVAGAYPSLPVLVSPNW